MIARPRISVRRAVRTIEETEYLLRSPRNAKRLRHAVEQLGAGEGTDEGQVLIAHAITLAR